MPTENVERYSESQLAQLDIDLLLYRFDTEREREIAYHSLSPFIAEESPFEISNPDEFRANEKYIELELRRHLPAAQILTDLIIQSALDPNIWDEFDGAFGEEGEFIEYLLATSRQRKPMPNLEPMATLLDENYVSFAAHKPVRNATPTEVINKLNERTSASYSDSNNRRRPLPGYTIRENMINQLVGQMIKIESQNPGEATSNEIKFLRTVNLIKQNIRSLIKNVGIKEMENKQRARVYGQITDRFASTVVKTLDQDTYQQLWNENPPGDPDSSQRFYTSMRNQYVRLVEQCYLPAQSEGAQVSVNHAYLEAHNLADLLPNIDTVISELAPYLFTEYEQNDYQVKFPKISQFIEYRVKNMLFKSPTSPAQSQSR